MTQEEKAKYHKTNPLFDECVKNCDPEIMKQVSDKIDDISRAEKKAPDTIFIPYDYILDDSLPAGVTKKLTFEGDIEYIRKDLATLTIEDIERLHTFLYAVKNNKQGVFTFTRLTDEQYEKVLRKFEVTNWFNKRKNK